MRIVDVTRGTVVATQAVAATSFWWRFRGLMFRRGFAGFDGLWLSPTASIHMFWVFFAIDVIWLDRDLRVLKVTPALKPWRLDAARGARSAVELPVGALATAGVATGDQLRFEDS